MTHDEALALIEPFYNLFRTRKRDWDKGFAVLADDWRAYHTNTDFRTKAETRPYLQGLFELIPDIDVDIKQLTVDGDTIAVRSEMSGTPARDFLVPHSGRSFRVMTIDLVRVKDGKIAQLFHVEDWSTAAAQLSAPKA